MAACTTRCRNGDEPRRARGLVVDVGDRAAVDQAAMETSPEGLVDQVVAALGASRADAAMETSPEGLVDSANSVVSAATRPPQWRRAPKGSWTSIVSRISPTTVTAAMETSPEGLVDQLGLDRSEVRQGGQRRNGDEPRRARGHSQPVDEPRKALSAAMETSPEGLVDPVRPRPVARGVRRRNGDEPRRARGPAISHARP